MERGFFDPFDQVRIVNLRRRSDRRIEVINELRRIGVSVDGSHVAFFDAIEPTDAERFRSIGARGCFYSHLEVLRRAQSDGACNLLILEDDAHFSRNFRVSARQVEVALKEQEWDLFYAGYAAHSSIALEQPLGRISPSLSLMSSHAVGFSPRAIDRVIPYLETMLTRPNGHPDGGPMDIDGAYSWFRRDNPDLITLVASPKIITQRSSVSDITPARLRDTIMQLSGLRKLMNMLF